MKKVLFSIGLCLLLAVSYQSQAQTVLDAEERNFNDFYKKDMNSGKQAMPYAPVRQADVVWERTIWRTIDFREKFNQFFFYPTETERNTQGRTNLVNLLLGALENGEIEVFEDDDLKVPKDWNKVYGEINRERIMQINDYDEWDEIIGSHDTTIHEEFNPEDVLLCKLKEKWYIDKQDTRQKVRIVGLALFRNDCRERAEGRECESVAMFWVPMDDMRVRNVLVKHDAYDEHNDCLNRTYDDIFITRYFDSFVTRVSDTKNRSISSYLTGTDAILESQRIEDDIFNIESDMWEY